MYKNLLDTRSNELTALLKVSFDINGVDYIIENEHVAVFNPQRAIHIKVNEDNIDKAKALIEGLPRTLREIKIV